jgi:hypothetical protein
MAGSCHEAADGIGGHSWVVADILDMFIFAMAFLKRELKPTPLYAFIPPLLAPLPLDRADGLFDRV